MNHRKRRETEIDESCGQLMFILRRFYNRGTVLFASSSRFETVQNRERFDSLFHRLHILTIAGNIAQ